MIDRVEVLNGEGTVIRHGNVVIWAAPAASPALISFLAQSARNLSGSARGGRQIADHIAGVLRDRDPEPQVAFAVVGPDEEGWASLLHGPVQAWDGTRWLAPTPAPGWLHEPVEPRPAVVVNHAGSHVPTVDPDGMWDLEGGVVRGGGFVLVPRAGGAQPGPDAGARGAPVSVGESGGGVGGVGGIGGVGGEAGAGGGEETGVMEVPEATALLQATSPPTSVIEAISDAPAGAVAMPVAHVAPEPSAPSASASPSAPPAARPPGSIDLTRAGDVLGGRSTTDPLPVGAGPDRPLPGAPVVAGVLCDRGHLNRPGTPTCVRCSSPLSRDVNYTVSGTRPGLGCLVLDDGTVWRLDNPYLVGSKPSRDPTVNGGMARALRLTGDDVDPSHADIRLKDWDVQVIDRASRSGTWIYEPGATSWTRLAPYEARTVRPGTHISFGKRIATFVTPWVDDPA